MRIAIVAAAALVTAACNTQQPPPPPDRAAIEAQTQALLKPLPESQHGPMSGFVSARDQTTLSLDSGGQHLVPLKVTAKTPTLRDGQPGSVADIREGDVVRAAYSMGPDGAPLATQIVVNSKSVTGRDTPPGTNAGQQLAQAAPEPQPMQVAPAAAEPAPPADPKTGEPPTVMEVSPVQTREVTR